MLKEEQNITKYLVEEYGLKLKQEDEEFRVIPNFTSYYVSNCGTVFSEKSKKTLTPIFNTKNYPFYRLMPDDGGKPVSLVEYVLVYNLFGDNEVNHEVLHHRDKNKNNSSISNLKPTTQQKNLSYVHGKPIIVTSKDGDCGYFLSTQEAARFLRINYSHIYLCLKGKKDSYKGFVFEYANDDQIIEI
jgi:hypothetical protein